MPLLPSRGHRRAALGAAVIGIAVCVASSTAVALSSDGTPSTRAAALPQDAPSPFDEIVPPADVDPKSPAAQQYTKFKWDLSDALTARSLLSAQIKARGMDAGWAGTIAHPRENSLTVYWKGEAPQELRDSLAKLPYGITVDLHEGAKYDRVEERAAASRVTAGPRAKEWNISGAAAAPMGKGIEIDVDGSPSAATKREIAEASGLPYEDVAFQTQVSGPKLTSRTDSAPPWRGGVQVQSLKSGTDYHTCTSGYSALKGTQGRLLGAEHCDPDGREVLQYGRQIAPGSKVYHRPAIDSLSMDPAASPATQAKVYVGSWNSSQVRGVQDWSTNDVGDDVCGSGAATGTKCGTIVQDDYSFPGYPGSYFIRARNGGLGMVGDGDSGGPVYATHSNGKKQARGIVMGGVGKRWTCQDAYAYDLECRDSLIYVPISIILNFWEYTLETE